MGLSVSHALTDFKLICAANEDMNGDEVDEHSSDEDSVSDDYTQMVPMENTQLKTDVY